MQSSEQCLECAKKRSAQEEDLSANNTRTPQTAEIEMVRNESSMTSSARFCVRFGRVNWPNSRRRPLAQGSSTTTMVPDQRAIILGSDWNRGHTPLLELTEATSVQCGVECFEADLRGCVRVFLPHNRTITSQHVLKSAFSPCDRRTNGTVRNLCVRITLDRGRMEANARSGFEFQEVLQNRNTADRGWAQLDNIVVKDFLLKRFRAHTVR